MNAQRVGVMALRRAAAKPSMALVAPSIARGLIVRSALQAQTLQSRAITTQKLSHDEANKVLASQRLNRPVAPHLTIYDPAQIWYGASIMQRYTGMAYAGALYAGSLAYLAAPLLGWHLESASLVAFAASLPVTAKVVLKTLAAFPFLFHSFNGVRHLVWDAAVKGFAKADIAKATNAIWVASVIGSLGLALLW
ncbi:succinate dehydrogenase (ubiquinone) cytochrome b560 subunit [Sporothrix schenckii 1099-18]|uniref:Succinate dehydrogenase, cytochrome b556 subunit n=2 Tax=Sporothrix schenckii TaxID=29908 RepID=U7Q1A1_SPOS1|nr:succinate dehydrogenase (ubiquinone) cytochrome b560 subunit [Sporothrix schenckii 1099-18]ERT00471.1 succinate dehydrogenase, cytochrome b556 subunit [Sporothrix schenckii ATCC 58251]KJR85034.1 succinate dehydrogenase (ubiquinone) cytochrome b560 subunit [Sporothrix schenckii 1099-18]